MSKQPVRVDFLLHYRVSSPPCPSLVPVCQCLCLLAAEMKRPVDLAQDDWRSEVPRETAMASGPLYSQHLLFFLLIDGEAALKL